MDDKKAAYHLLELAATAAPEIEIIETVHEKNPTGNGYSIITLQLPEDDIEWCGLGLLFAIAVLSFADARPRGYSENLFEKDDDFQLADFLECLKYVRGSLDFSSDYIRGRCMKTRIVA
ncbi:MAG TPA: hypothetical protein EYP19_09620 [Desulfobacterales bacterium]|nr:hypothetical protein [Desulfobacterales bacterium]